MKWILKTFEDDKGNPDHVRLTGFYFCILIGYIVGFNPPKTWIDFATFSSLLVAIGVLYKLVNVKDIIAFKTGVQA